TGHDARTFPTPAYSTDNPGVNVAATEWLAHQGIVHFGIDSMRPGPMGVVNSLVHKACLEPDITHMESLCNLEALLGQGEFRFIGLPLKWRGGTGSPIRAVAVFEGGYELLAGIPGRGRSPRARNPYSSAMVMDSGPRRCRGSAGMTARVDVSRKNLLRRLGAELLGGAGDPRALRIDLSRERGGSAEIGNLP